MKNKPFSAAKITFGNGNVAEYTYTANGTKLKTEYFVKVMDQMLLRQEACREYCGSDHGVLIRVGSSDHLTQISHVK